jgi:hypothetical protein
MNLRTPTSTSDEPQDYLKVTLWEARLDSSNAAVKLLPMRPVSTYEASMII